MTVTEFTAGSHIAPSVRISAVAEGLQKSERRVLDYVRQHPEQVVESTAQELAEQVGVARSSVIRACQSLGYRGYAQLRVAVTRELAQTAQPEHDHGTSALGRIRTDVDALAAELPKITQLLSEEAVTGAVTAMTEASRLLVVANGLSAPLATDLALRLTAIGRSADVVSDSIGQQIAARQLTPADACVIISGSGSSQPSLLVAQSVREARARLIVISSFLRSPLAALADLTLVVAPARASFRNELEHTSRVPHMILIESLVSAIAHDIGASAQRTRADVLEIISANLAE